MPLAPDVTVSHSGSPDTVHWQRRSVVTSTLSDPPACGKVRLLVESV
jgi:hypothetical protein